MHKYFLINIHNSIWGIELLSQIIQAKKNEIRQIGFVCPALPFIGIGI